MYKMGGWPDSLEPPVNNAEIMHMIQSPSNANQLVVKERYYTENAKDLGKNRHAPDPVCLQWGGSLNILRGRDVLQNQIRDRAGVL